jgi:hypothetical protein
MPRRKPTTEETDTATSPESTEMPTAEATLEMEATTETAKPKIIKGERLVGQALLDYVLANRSLPSNEVVFGAGYYSKRIDPETGEEKITYQKQTFHEAINAANGIELAPATRAYAPRKNRSPVIKLGKQGSIVVGGRHSEVAGFAPETKVEVKAEPGRITIIAFADGDTEAADTSAELEL